MVSEQDEVPLQLRVLHWSLLQLMKVPLQVPLLHTSLYVHALPSSEATPFFAKLAVHSYVPCSVSQKTFSQGPHVGTPPLQAAAAVGVRTATARTTRTSIFKAANRRNLMRAMSRLATRACTPIT